MTSSGGPRGTSRKPGRRRLSRKHRIRLSIAISVLGCGAVLFAATQVESARDTDLTDERAGVTQRLADPVPEAATRLRLTDVTADVGISVRHGPGIRHRNLPEDTGSGLAWGDYDGDGDPDLYFVDLARTSDDAEGGNRLLRNDGGRFTDVTAQAGVADAEGMGMGASFADFDGDGDLDLHVTNNGPDRLFRNQGDGTFVDVAADVGVSAPGWSVGAAWGDFDEDGDLDLYVCSYLQYEELPASSGALESKGTYLAPPALNPKSFEATPNHLFSNRGDGTFEDVAVALGVDDPGGRSFAATFCDLNGDGHLDLYVNNDASPNSLFLASRDEAGGAGFVDASLRTGTADPRGSMGLSVADIAGADGQPDGVPDLFVTHWVTQQNALYEGVLDPDGGLIYCDRAQRMRLGEISRTAVGWGTAMVDLDADGRRELLVANGSTLEDEASPPRLVPQRPFLFWNGDGRFHEVATHAGESFARARVARGLAVADYDGDGDCDVAMVVNRGPLLLFRNDTPASGRSLSVRLAGSAAESYGARIQVTAGTRVFTWWYGVDVSYASQHDPAAPVGLGAAEGPLTVDVRWHGGRTSKLENVSGPNVELR